MAKVLHRKTPLTERNSVQRVTEVVSELTREPIEVSILLDHFNIPEVEPARPGKGRPRRYRLPE